MLITKSRASLRPMTDLSAMLDLNHYHLHKPGSPAWSDLVCPCKGDLDRDGLFNLEGFLKTDAAAQIVAAFAPKFETVSFSHVRSHNIYFKRSIDGLAPDHPALMTFENSNQTLCADQFACAPLIAVYEWPEFAGFLAAVMEKPMLYTMIDPLARVNAMSYSEGQALNWHFDRSEFTTTLLLQAPVAGGEFEYRTELRSDQDPNYDGVAALLRGNDPAVKRLFLTPGTLNVFKGRNTAHRVTPVKGATARIISVFFVLRATGRVVFR